MVVVEVASQGMPETQNDRKLHEREENKVREDLAHRDTPLGSFVCCGYFISFAIKFSL